MTTNNNRDFEFALAEVCRRVQGGEPLERCLVDYPAEYHDDLRQLVPLAGRVAAVASDPSPLYRARLEQRLIGAVEARRAAQATAWRGWFGGVPALRYATLAAVLLLLFGGGGIGVTQAARDTLPDSPLYGVKHAQEGAQLLMAPNDEARSAVLEGHAEQREQEITAAFEAGKRRPVLERLVKEVLQTSERWVGLAEREALDGKLGPAMRAQQGVRELLNRVDRQLEKGTPETREILRGLREILEGHEQRLAELQRRRRPPPRLEPARPEPARPAPLRETAAPAEPTAAAPARVAEPTVAAPVQQRTVVEPTPASPIRPQPTATAGAPIRTPPTPTPTAPTRTPPLTR